MKVKELKEKLDKLNEELEVYLAVDSEWNGFGTTDPSGVTLVINKEGKDLYVVLSPYEEGLDYEDLK